MKKILITGGAGFIGSHIVDALIKKGERVVVLDNLFSGKLENLKAVASKIEFVKSDIRQLNKIKKVFKGVDYVLHLAALGSVVRSMKNPIDTNEVNITGTLNVLSAAKEAKVKRVVYASSSSVYGLVKGQKNQETDPVFPRSPYALTKLDGEHYCRLFYQIYGLETVSLRYFNVFGPRQDPSSPYAAVIPHFIKLLLAGVAPTIYGSGEQSRDFTYVENVVSANLLALDAKKVELGGAYNIGCGESASVNSLYHKLTKIIETDIKPAYAPKRPGDVFKTRAAIVKARQDFGYRPIINFENGLKKTVEWVKKSQ